MLCGEPRYIIGWCSRKDQALRLSSVVDWVLKPMLPDQNVVFEESTGQVQCSVCGAARDTVC